MLTDKTTILAFDDQETVDVIVPEWRGETVRLRSMTADDRDGWETAIIVRNDLPPAERQRGLRARLVALCAVNDRGERIFGDEDVAALARKSAKAIDRLFDAAMKLNRLGAKDVEDEVKN